MVFETLENRMDMKIRNGCESNLLMLILNNSYTGSNLDDIHDKVKFDQFQFVKYFGFQLHPVKTFIY